MSDEDSSSSQGQKSWLEKISQAFTGEPQSADELLEVLRDAESRQVIDSDSLGLIEGAIQVTDMQVREVMIPRSQMVTVKLSQDPKEYLVDIMDSAHSRFPVIGESTDEIIGILLAKDLIPLLFKGELKRDHIKDLMRPATFVPESKRLNQLLKEFKENRNHMAIVIDEYGGVAGLVTIEDVLEQIVGEIEDEHDFDDEAMIKERSRNEYAVKALVPIDEFNAYFDTVLDEEEFDTIGGLLLKQFGHLPTRGEAIEFEGFRFSVLNADNRTIRLINVERL